MVELGYKTSCRILRSVALALPMAEAVAMIDSKEVVSMKGK